MKINNNSFGFQSCWSIIALILVCAGIGRSYGQTKNEVSLYLEGAFSKLDYEILQENSKMKNGYGLGVGYAYYLSEKWSIGTGAELQYMEGSAYRTSVQDAYSTLDMEGEEFEFRYQVEDLKENQYTYFLNLPLNIQYETGDIFRFYAAAGAKIGFVLQSEYATEASSLITSGYYQQYDAVLNDPKFAGFGNFGAIKYSKSELDLQANLLLNLETGIKLMLENDQALYMGLFADFGLKDIKPKENQKNLIAYNAENPVNFRNNSILSSVNQSSSTSFVEDVKTLAFGLKITYAFQF